MANIEDDTNPKQEVPAPPIDLDAVHAHSVHQVEEEGELDDEGNPITSDDSDDTGDEAGGGSSSDDTDDTTGDDGGDDDTEEGDPAADKGKDDEPVVPTPVTDKPEVISPKPELNTDITVKVEGKVAIKDADGNTFYFNNTDEIPDDFEPASYKELMTGTKALYKKEAQDEQSAKDAAIAAEQQRQQAEIDAVTNSWDKDIDVLTKGGVLPKEKEARETEIGDTYAYISKKLADGVIIDSFAEAHKAMKYDQQQEAKAKKAKEDAKNTKERGGKVLSGGGAISNKGKVIDAPPAGTSLDAVHARYAGLK